MKQKTRKIRYKIAKLLLPNTQIGKPSNLPRPMTQALKQRFGDKELAGVEIGIRSGLNAENILSYLNIKKLFLIDPCYSPKAEKRLKRFSQAIFAIAKSSEVVISLPSGLDFIYIDGDHSYEAVIQDIELYYPKVKSGGIIGGHDFAISHLGVCKAVMEFVQKNNLKLQGHIHDWWIIKS